jgi:hypothetical protein
MEKKMSDKTERDLKLFSMLGAELKLSDAQSSEQQSKFYIVKDRFGITGYGTSPYKAVTAYLDEWGVGND